MSRPNLNQVFDACSLVADRSARLNPVTASSAYLRRFWIKFLAIAPWFVWSGMSSGESLSPPALAGESIHPGVVISLVLMVCLSVTVMVLLNLALRQIKLQRSASEAGRKLKLIEASVDAGSWEINVKTDRSTWSEGTYRLFGRDPETFDPNLESFLDGVHPDDRAGLEETYRLCILDASDLQISYRIYRDDEVVHLVTTGKANLDSRGQVVSYRGITRDISNLKRAELALESTKNALSQTRKLEAIGTLSSGIAHDFNNILAPILGYSELIMARTDDADPVHSQVGHILNGAHKAKALVSRILMLSRQIDNELRPVDLVALVEEVIELLRPSAPKLTHIEFNVDASISQQVNRQTSESGVSVLADASQIHQVIINLCTNAWQSLAGEEGYIRIRLHEEHITTADQPSIRPGKFIRPDYYYCLSFTDTGMGISDEVRERIFEPFFTTRSVDSMTGMGLSAVRSTMRRHQGDIRVTSSVGIGSCFELLFPMAPADKRVKVEEVELQREQLDQT